jgi:PST family polysaccharide transporter
LNPFASSASRPQAAGGEVRLAAVRGVGATFLSGGMGLAIQLASGAVLARLLPPKDFGMVAMVTTIGLLFLNFGLNGFTEAVVQAEEIDREVASNLFWLNVAGSLILSIGFAAAGSLLARLYHEPRISGITEALSLTILLTGISVLHLALLKRFMKFREVSLNDFVARVVSVAVAIVLGFAGWGYWALVAGALVLSASTTTGALIMCRWVPNLPRRAPGTAKLVRFAANTYVRFATGYISNNMDNFLVGWFLGPVSLGYYKRAFDLFALPTVQLGFSLTNVAVSALSRFQRDLVQYKRHFLGALGIMAFVGMALSADLTLAGKDIIFVLLGPKWNETGRIFTIFGPGIGMMLLYSSHIWINLSIGRADRWLRWGMVDLTISALAIVVGLHWGAEGVALGWVAAYWVITLPALWYAGRPIQLGIGSMIGVIWRYAAAAAMAGGEARLIERAIPNLSTAPGIAGAIARISVNSLSFVALYLGAVIVLHNSFGPLRQLARLLRDMTSRSRFTIQQQISEHSAASSES